MNVYNICRSYCNKFVSLSYVQEREYNKYLKVKSSVDKNLVVAAMIMHVADVDRLCLLVRMTFV